MLWRRRRRRASAACASFGVRPCRRRAAPHAAGATATHAPSRRRRPFHARPRPAFQEEEPSPFNQCLRKLKDKYLANAAKTQFWFSVVNDPEMKGGLITVEETEESQVTPEQAAAFLVVDARGPTQNDDAAADALEDEDEYGGLD